MIALASDHTGIELKQEIIALPGGGVELRFEAASDPKLIAWVMSFGSDAELLETAHIRQKIKDDLEEAWELYATEEDYEEGEDD